MAESSKARLSGHEGALRVKGECDYILTPLSIECILQANRTTFERLLYFSKSVLLT